MTITDILSSFGSQSEAGIMHLEQELKKLRTGRAHSSMLDGLMIEAYGQKMPIISLATISVPEPQLLQINPFDPSTLAAIVNSIRENTSLGFNPTDDGRVIRIPIPPLTAERRQQLIKQIGTIKESSMVALRQVRHDSLKQAETVKKNKEASDDDIKRLEKQIDEKMQIVKLKIDQIVKSKEESLLLI